MRLGHPSQSVMKNMLINEKVCFKVPPIFCDACHIDKSKHKHYHSSPKSSNKPLKIIRSDVWGASPILSKDGYRYYVHFVDEYNDFTWIYPLRLKSDVKETFIHFQKFVERKFEHKIKTLHSDWGGEYRSLVPFLNS